MAETETGRSIVNLRPTSPQATAQFYINLESLRGICALAICLLHLPFETHFMRILGAKEMWLFVDLFFVLSGFVIAHVYVDRLNDLRDSNAFMIKRFFRLYPLHLATMLAMAALLFMRYLLEPANTVETYQIDDTFWFLSGMNFLLLHSWVFPDRFILNSPSWSISTELFAYVMFALTAFAVRSSQKRFLVWACIASTTCLILWFYNDQSLDGFDGMRIVRCIYGFALGVLSCWLSRRFSRIGTQYSLPLQMVSITFLLLLLPATALEESYSLAFPVITMLLVAAMALDPGTRLRVFWERPSLRLLGRLSYSIYLTHAVIITIIGTLINAFARDLTSNPWFGDLLALVVIALVICTSLATYRFIEAPGREFGKRLANRMMSVEPQSNRPNLKEAR